MHSVSVLNKDGVRKICQYFVQSQQHVTCVLSGSWAVILSDLVRAVVKEIVTVMSVSLKPSRIPFLCIFWCQPHPSSHLHVCEQEKLAAIRTSLLKIMIFKFTFGESVNPLNFLFEDSILLLFTF